MHILSHCLQLSAPGKEISATLAHVQVLWTLVSAPQDSLGQAV